MPEVGIVEVVRLYVGRGLRAEPVGEDDDKLEISVNLHDLGVELDQALAAFEQARGRVWQPLTTVVGGVPELVWEADDGLIPTQVPAPHLGVEDATVNTETGETEAP